MSEDERLEMSVIIDGQTFKAAGKREDVLRLYAEWQQLAGIDIPEPRVSNAFNAPRMVKR